MTEQALVDALKKIHRPSGAGKLFGVLGYEPPRHGLADTVVAASWKAYFIAVERGRHAEQIAPALARRIGTAGRSGLALAIDADRIALSTPRVRAGGATRPFVVDIHDPGADAIQLLARLRPRTGASALSHAFRIEEILSGEDVGARFFSGFRRLLDRFESQVGVGPSSDRRLTALLPLVRMLFLYFVQAKGWLAGNPEYLREAFDDAVARRRQFHRDVLNPLFYETLNRPPTARPRHAPRRIPYLNGGLFTVHPVETRLGQPMFSNGAWRHAFEDLFDRFRFCLREDDTVDAIAPDMLGRVFEQVMTPTTRRATGTFYTPEAIVNRVVSRAIELSLRGCCNLEPRVIRRIVQGEPIDPTLRRRARHALDRLRILDPAAGSGAFLLGALHRMTEMHLGLLALRRPDSVRRIRHRVLARNLFGVDLDPIAVTLAELRLWLAIVADDPTQDIKAVQPLPNLAGIVRQGNSLIDPIGSARALGHRAPTRVSQVIETVAGARTSLFTARGREHEAGAATLRQTEGRLAAELLTHASDQVERELRDLLHVARAPNLFGEPTRLTRGQRDAFSAKRRTHRALRQALRAVRDGTLPFFSFDVHMPDVTRQGGFTTVIGNPPWVRAERLAPATRAMLQHRFSWWRTLGGRGFRHSPDLAVAFLQRAFELTRPGGTLALLLPSKVLSAGYGESARRHLAAEATLDLLHRVDDTEATPFGATTYPTVVIARRTTPREASSVALDYERHVTLRQRTLAQPGPWQLVPGTVQRALEAFMSSGDALAEVAPPALGIKTGSNGVFVGRITEEHDGLCVVQFGVETVTVERATLRPVVRGRDIRPWGATASRSIIWAYHDGAARPVALPSRARRYLNRHRAVLVGRADHTGGDLATLFRLQAARSHHRVVWPDITGTPVAAAIDCTPACDALPLNSCYVCAAPDENTALAITAVINSTWTAALVSITADEARGGYRRMNAGVMRRLPVPTRGPHRTRLVELSREAHQGTGVDQDTLDDAVAIALHLTASTRATLLRYVAEYRR